MNSIVLFLLAADAIWVDDWVHFGNHWYKFFEDQHMTGQEAVKACRDNGGLLVSINSQQEHQFISVTVLRERALSAFSGGSDVQDGKITAKK